MPWTTDSAGYLSGSAGEPTSFRRRDSDVSSRPLALAASRSSGRAASASRGPVPARAPRSTHAPEAPIARGGPGTPRARAAAATPRAAGSRIDPRDQSLRFSASGGALSLEQQPGGPSAEHLTGAGLALSGVCARVPILISLHRSGAAYRYRRHDGDGGPPLALSHKRTGTTGAQPRVQ